MDFTDAYFCGASKADAISYSEKNWCEAITSSYPPAPLSTHHSYPCHAPPPPPVQVCMAMGRASGWVEWQGHRIEFTDAVTYSEKNWGGAFPLKWFWIQCNVWSHVPLGSAVALFGPLSPHIARSFPPPYTLSHQIQCNVWSHVSLGSAVALTVAGAKRQLNLPLLANSVEEVGMVNLPLLANSVEEVGMVRHGGVGHGEIERAWWACTAQQSIGFVPNRGAVEWRVPLITPFLVTPSILCMAGGIALAGAVNKRLCVPGTSEVLANPSLAFVSMAGGLALAGPVPLSATLDAVHAGGGALAGAVHRVGLHWQGQFIEFVPNRGAVEWKVQPWGSWHMHAHNEQYEVTVEAHTLPGDNGTPLRAPTAEGMRFFCKDSFDGRVKLELRQRYSGQLLLRAESTAAAVEVGGGPWWEAWEQRSRMNPAQSAVISLPLNLSTLLPPSLQPPGL
ncbi:unnamed protein product [Closterium sp. NIES-64]|nr:unnamed protein product [Closterium sp. NIES-64]